MREADYCTELRQSECRTVIERANIVLFEKLLKQLMDLKTDPN